MPRVSQIIIDLEYSVLEWSCLRIISGPEFGKANAFSASIVRAISLDSSGNLAMQTQGAILGMQEGQAGQGGIGETCSLSKAK